MDVEKHRVCVPGTGMESEKRTSCKSEAQPAGEHAPSGQGPLEGLWVTLASPGLGSFEAGTPGGC